MGGKTTHQYGWSLFLSCPPCHLSLLPRPQCSFPLSLRSCCSAWYSCQKHQNRMQVAVAAQEHSKELVPRLMKVDIGLLALEQALVHTLVWTSTCSTKSKPSYTVLWTYTCLPMSKTPYRMVRKEAIVSESG